MTLPKNTFFLFSLLALAFLMATLFAIAQTSWQEPTATPPGDNVSAPINVGPEPQTKQGGLNILGKLGIGKENPEVEVDVEGEIRATERICVKNPVTGDEICIGKFTQLPVAQEHPVVCGKDFNGQNEGYIYYNNKNTIENNAPGQVCICLGVRTSQFPDGWSCAAQHEQLEPQAKTVFTTSVEYDGDLGGILGANQICQERAEAGCQYAKENGLTQLEIRMCGDKEWRAWLSTENIDAKDNIECSDNKAYITSGGAEVAGNILTGTGGCSDLTDGYLTNPILHNEFGEEFDNENVYVWTGTYIDGTNDDKSQSRTFLLPDCASWSTNDREIRGSRGAVKWYWEYQLDCDWTTYKFSDCYPNFRYLRYYHCYRPHHLYCFEL
jgi:hypothetical protein